LDLVFYSAQMFAVTPSVRPWFSESTDLFSIVGNCVTILGFLISCVTLWVASRVKQKVARIEKEYALRLRVTEWRKQIDVHATALLEIYGASPFVPNDASEELTRIAAFIKITAAQLPDELERLARQTVGKITDGLHGRWWKKKKPLDDARVYDFYLNLVDLSEHLKHSASRAGQKKPR